MSNEIWVDLLMGTSEDRRNFSEVKAEMLTQEKIESLVMGCFEVNRIINYQAKRIDEEFDLVRSNAAIDEKKPTNLRHRVRMTEKHTMRDEWYKVKMSFGKPKFKNLDRKGKYSFSVQELRGQPQWVRDYFKQTEDKLTLLRMQNDVLSSIRKSLYHLSDLFAKFHRLQNGDAGVSANILASIYGQNLGDNKVGLPVSSTGDESEETKDQKKLKDIHDLRKIDGVKMQAILDNKYPQFAKIGSTEDEE